MAVPNQTPYKKYTANGSTTQFSLGFNCESKDHLIITIDEVEAVTGSWSLSNGNVIFSVAPGVGKEIELKRNTPASRSTDYQSYNNSFNPQTINKDIDWIWLKLQELGVADQLLKIYADRLHIEQQGYIENQDQLIRQIILDLRNYVNQQDDKRNSYFEGLINQQGTSLSQLQQYYNALLQNMANIAGGKDWIAALVQDQSGSSQQAINNLGGVNFWSNKISYDLHNEVRLDTGDIVKSTIPKNTGNPNSDMRGWVNPSAIQNAKNEIYDKVATGALTIPDNTRAGALGGAIRVDSSGTPFIINNASHLGFGLTGAEVGSTVYDLKLKYDHGFSKVGSLLATADETLVAYMLSAGGSVGQNYADLKIVAPLYFTMLGNVISGISPLWASYVTVADSGANHVTLNTPLKADSFCQPVVSAKNNAADTRAYGDYTAYSSASALKITAWRDSSASCRLRWDGSAFVASMSNLTGISATVSGNQITITHPAATGSTSASGRGIDAFGSVYNYIMTSITSTTTVISVYASDRSTPLFVMDTNVSFLFNYTPLVPVTSKANIADKEFTVFAGYYYVPVAALGKISGGNLWVSGSMIE